MVFYIAFLAYSLVIAGQLLLGVFPAFIIVFLYIIWRLLAAVEAIADAQQRIASQQEENG